MAEVTSPEEWKQLSNRLKSSDMIEFWLGGYRFGNDVDVWHWPWSDRPMIFE